jgi:low temperature requirement protein LtrA
MLEPTSIDSILRMNVPALRRNTFIMAPLFLIVAVACLVPGVFDEVRRPLWWAAAAIEAFLGPTMLLVRLRYLAVIEAVQNYVAERDRSDAAAAR